jgi:hypothetical protein
MFILNIVLNNIFNSIYQSLLTTGLQLFFIYVLTKISNLIYYVQPSKFIGDIVQIDSMERK